MAVKIRLKKLGRRKRPFYRIVAIDSRFKRDGREIERLGWYDPVQTSHSLMSPLEREKAGISDTLIRYSVGIESANDLIADLKQALG